MRVHARIVIAIFLVILSSSCKATGPAPKPTGTNLPAKESTPTDLAANPTPTPELDPPIDPFIVSNQKFGNGSSFSLALGDLDRDGNLDVLVANYKSASQVWLNNGSNQGSRLGTFIGGQNIGTSTGHGVALGDLDGDGDSDVFLVHNMDTDQVWLNDGAGNLVDSGQQLGEADDATTSASLADVDNDGDLDVFTVHYQKPLRLWLNNGSGVFTAADLALGTDALSVASGDVDNDGDLDALIAYIEKPNKLWLNNGKGDFTDSGQMLGSKRGWGNATFGDVDEDGDLDVLLASTMGGSIWLNDGVGNFTDSGQVLGMSHYVVVGDIDNDDDLDAITCDELWMNNGSGTFSIVNSKNKMQGCSGVWLGDVDGDGDLDAFVGSYLSSNKLWLNTTLGER